MASENSDLSQSSDDQTIEYEIPTRPNRRRAAAPPAVQRRQRQGQVQRRQNAQNILTTLARKKEKLRELVAELKEDEMRTILQATIDKSPDILWDVLDCGRFDGQPQTQSASSSQDPEPPSPDPSSSSECPSWCVCGNCQDMPTAEERLCCGKAPDYCISRLPHFQLVALDENVLQVANIYRQDIFAYPEDVDNNRGFRHAAYRQYTMWQHGRLGAGHRKVIPSCCVVRIRQKYPDPYGQYVGYIPGRLG